MTGMRSPVPVFGVRVAEVEEEEEEEEEEGLGFRV
jgi:hypothetical protein